MSRAIRSTLATATVAALALVAPLPAGACSCIVRDLTAQVGAASAIFEGSVRSTNDGGAVFDVTHVYKGSVPTKASVDGGDQASSCAIPFTIGRSYVVFAVSQGGTLATDLCSGTTDDLSTTARLTTSVGLPTPQAGSPGFPGTLRAARTVPIALASALVGLLGVAILISALNQRRPRPIA